jgi:hypothetical protein
VIDLPEIVKSIIREPETDLRVTLESASAGPNDQIQNITLLELAIGWLAVVQILLELGADAAEVELRRSSYRSLGTDDGDCDNYLLQFGDAFASGRVYAEREDILNCTSRKVRSMFIREFSSRKKRLQALAPSCLPPERLLKFW